MTEDFVIEVDHHQAVKYGQPVGGDVFLSRKVPAQDRIVAVLADGLGSGVKANVLATLTSTMAASFVTGNTDIRQTARFIMDTLPICRERKIAYSTFTIVDIEDGSRVRIIEHDNPRCLVIRDGKELAREIETVSLPPGSGNIPSRRDLHFSNLQAREGDRIIVFSDGLSQAGMGSRNLPLGWGEDGVLDFAVQQIAMGPCLSARELSLRLVARGVQNDGDRAKDDITCAVIYFRRPRRLLLVTGPPFARESDAFIAEKVSSFPGKCIIAGGTTAGIVARELGRQINMDLSDLDPRIPPTSHMPGVDLVTEGSITLARVVEMLENGEEETEKRSNGATRIHELLLNSDIVELLVGSRINEAHQNPNTPVELDFRRNLMKRMCQVLNEKYLKDTRLQFI